MHIYIYIYTHTSLSLSLSLSISLSLYISIYTHVINALGIYKRGLAVGPDLVSSTISLGEFTVSLYDLT